MPRRPAPLDPLVLFPRRLAGRALAMALDGYSLAGVSRKFNADDPAECLPGIARDEFVFGDVSGRWAPLATVYLEGASARVIVEDIEKLIRPNHLRDFEPESLGIFHTPGRPDIDVTTDLTEVLEGDEGELLRTAPQRVLPQHMKPSYRPRVIRSTGRGS